MKGKKSGPVEIRTLSVIEAQVDVREKGLGLLERSKLNQNNGTWCADRSPASTTVSD